MIDLPASKGGFWLPFFSSPVFRGFFLYIKIKENIMTEKYILSIGLNDKDTKEQIIDKSRSYKIVEDILIKNGINGGTIYDTTGFYRHEDGVIVREPSLRVEILFSSKSSVMEACKALKEEFNQETIVFEKISLESQLV